jgi:hypothetical protein
VVRKNNLIGLYSAFGVESVWENIKIVRTWKSLGKLETLKSLFFLKLISLSGISSSGLV